MVKVNKLKNYWFRKECYFQLVNFYTALLSGSMPATMTESKTTKSGNPKFGSLKQEINVLCWAKDFERVHCCLFMSKVLIHCYLVICLSSTYLFMRTSHDMHSMRKFFYIFVIRCGRKLKSEWIPFSVKTCMLCVLLRWLLTIEGSNLFLLT